MILPLRGGVLVLACLGSVGAGCAVVSGLNDFSVQSDEGSEGDQACLGGACQQACSPGVQEVCYSGLIDTAGVGACKTGVRTCADDGSAFGPCVGEALPTLEQCTTLADEDCDGEPNAGCVFARCGDVPAGSPSGVYTLDPDGDGPEAPLDTYCDLVTDGGGWALVYSSVGSPAGETTAFWMIPYDDRFKAKGTPSPLENFYAGTLYLHGTEYRDEIEDLLGTTVEVMRATAAGIDQSTMHFIAPVRSSGHLNIYNAQFAGGWSARDFDADLRVSESCSDIFLDVMQHYANCWIYNLGADADSPQADAHWGPHLQSTAATSLGLAHDGSGYSRVQRISRWTRW